MKNAVFNESIILCDDDYALCALIGGDENIYEGLESEVGQDIVVIDELGKQIIPTGALVFCYMEEFGCGTWMLESFIDYKD